MYLNRYLFLAFLFCFALASCNKKAGSSKSSSKLNFISQDFSKAKKQSKETGKPIFMKFSTDWCMPCKMMDKHVFTDPRVVEFFNENFISLDIDPEKGEGEDLAITYKVQVIPQFCILKADGRVLETIAGSLGSSALMDFGRAGLNKNK